MKVAETGNIKDLELAKLCAQGDERARKELYTKYAALIYALCIRYLGDKELARDLMHDSMIKIYDTVWKYKPTGSLKSWCSRVAINTVIDYIRKSRRIDLIPLEQTQEKVPTPSEDDITKIPKTELLKMIASLPESKRLIFNLFCMERYSHKEISQMLDIKEKTSSSLLFKAREQLAKAIKDYIKRNGL